MSADSLLCNLINLYQTGLERVSFITTQLNKNALKESERERPAGNTKGGSIIVLLTFCLTGLNQSVLQQKQKLPVVIQLNPNQSNRRSTVQ
jgi:hypothetical protein